MSFDLLNDKISFLNEGPSWGGCEDDTFDFKKEEAKMLAIAEEYERLITDETIPMPNPIRRSRYTQVTLVEWLLNSSRSPSQIRVCFSTSQRFQGSFEGDVFTRSRARLQFASENSLKRVRYFTSPRACLAFRTQLVVL